MLEADLDYAAPIRPCAGEAALAEELESIRLLRGLTAVAHALSMPMTLRNRFYHLLVYRNTARRLRLPGAGACACGGAPYVALEQ